LDAQGSSYGRSDINIEAGMPADKAAAIILDGLAAKQREIVVAEGIELAAISMRSQNPEALFALAAREGARFAALREKEGPGFKPAPAKFNAENEPRQ
jgi:dehydrogenase/reductase SDR family member 7B